VLPHFNRRIKYNLLLNFKKFRKHAAGRTKRHNKSFTPFHMKTMPAKLATG
jgi:hypothetical protein